MAVKTTGEAIFILSKCRIHSPAPNSQTVQDKRIEQKGFQSRKDRYLPKEKIKGWKLQKSVSSPGSV